MNLFIPVLYNPSPFDRENMILLVFNMLPSFYPVSFSAKTYNL